MTKRFQFKNERGQTLTEFAIVLPILCLLLFGVIQFGIAFNNYITLTDAVRAGARKGAVGRHLQDPQAAVVDSVEESGHGSQARRSRDHRHLELGAGIGRHRHGDLPVLDQLARSRREVGPALELDDGASGMSAPMRATAKNATRRGVHQPP